MFIRSRKRRWKGTYEFGQKFDLDKERKLFICFWNQAATKFEIRSATLDLRAQTQQISYGITLVLTRIKKSLRNMLRRRQSTGHCQQSSCIHSLVS